MRIQNLSVTDYPDYSFQKNSFITSSHTLSWKTYPEWHFQVFTAPNVHAFIVRAYFVKQRFINGEQATGHGWRSQRCSFIVMTPLHFTGRHSIPTETIGSSIKLNVNKVQRTHHRKFSFQLKPPHVWSDAVTYSKVSSDMTSMIGQTTVVRSTAIRASRGSSQPSVHSQWASKNVITWP